MSTSIAASAKGRSTMAVFAPKICEAWRAARSTKHRKRLLDSAEFCAALGQAGAELVLHGHDHRFLEAEIDGANGPVPVFGVPSASARPYSDKPGAHYFLHEVEKTAAGWSLTVRAQGLHPEDGRFVERFTRTIELERPRAVSDRIEPR